jgi:O-antigen biosynthesis protein WbqV
VNIRHFLRSRFRIPRRGWYVFAHDVVMAALSFLLSLYLRVGDAVPLFFPTDTLVLATVVFTAIAGAVFLLTNLYRGVWRYASLSDLLAVARASTLTVALFLLVLFVWTRLEPMPRSVPFINWLVLTALLGGPRFLYRTAKDRRMDLRLEASAGRKVPVLLVGAGHEAALFIRALRQQSQRVYEVVGILAEKQKRVGQRIEGIPILGTADQLTRTVRDLDPGERQPERVILTTEAIEGGKVRSLLDEATGLGMTLARLPKLTEFKSGVGDRIEVRPIAVEDLLGRPQMPLDRAAMRTMIAGRRIAVTGAGGSIGSELVRQIAGFDPALLILLDSSEYNLYAIEAETAGRYPALFCPAVLADVRDRRRVSRLIGSYRPELVFHAAALKHVPLVESNPFEGVLTNVIGTANVADACLEGGAAAMVLISTDKAVNPSSIMGATKRIAERYCQALDIGGGGEAGTRFVTVRFGNVLGSTGSVVPLFQKQIAAGGPLTVTHPEMKRYFMTTREAVELVLQASVLGRRGDVGEGRIFVLEMGEPVRILDLARQMIRLAGLEPDVDIRIEFTGIRPGEKLFEELFEGREALMPTGSAGLLLATPAPAEERELKKTLAALAEACADADHPQLLRWIRRLVPEYRGLPADEKRAATA